MQQRIVLSFMGFLASAISYSMRSCFSVAITEMTEPIINTNQLNRSTICGNQHDSQNLNNTKAHSVSDVHFGGTKPIVGQFYFRAIYF